MQNGATPVGQLATSPETAAREMDKGILYGIGTPLKTVSPFYNHDYDVNNLYSYDVNSLVVAAIRTQGSIITMVVEQCSWYNDWLRFINLTSQRKLHYWS